MNKGNRVIFDKNHKLICECQEKIEECTKHGNYILLWTKWGKRWNYYMAIVGRLIKENEKLLSSTSF